ncbi:MAG: outer membrane beta-barrel protein [Verrucomicrobiae bacterium]|nr:outer membrane beta-barrel protein [Verrucomicrobiae bacterium]NNJ44031.1 outer membrane beta-barrel protein [Akkermansiaceae bacterium]
MKTSTQQSFLPFACVTALFVPSISAQTTDVHPRGIFDTPQPGLDAPLARTPADADDWSDKFHFSLSASVRSDGNIFLSDKGEESDVIFSVSPTLRYVSAEAGAAENTFAISYTPNFQVYSENTDRNNIGHSLSIRLDKSMPKTQIGFNLNYRKSSGSDRFVSGTIDRDSLSAGVTVSYLLSGKTRLNAGVNYDFDDFSNGSLFGNDTYAANLGLSYQATGKISLGPYLSYRVSEMSAGSLDQDSVSYGMKGTYEVSGKTAIHGSVGYSVDSFDGASSASDHSSLVWRIGASHALSSKTNIRASLYSGTKASYSFADSGYLATGVALSASHQLSSRLSCYVSGMYEQNDYFRASALGTSLDNDYYSIALGTRYQCASGLMLGANISYSSNKSSSSTAAVGQNDFDNLTFGVNASYDFW